MCRLSRQLANVIDENINALRKNGYCVLSVHLPESLVEECRERFWPVLLQYLPEHGNAPNHGLGRYYLPMPFECFSPLFFFDDEILSIVRSHMCDRVVASAIAPTKSLQLWDSHVQGKPIKRAAVSLFRPGAAIFLGLTVRLVRIWLR